MPVAAAAAAASQRDKVAAASRQAPGAARKKEKAALPTLPSQSKPLRCPWFWQYQPKAHKFYTRTDVEIFVATLIGGNFLCNMIEATIDPAKELYQAVFGGFELFFNIAFTIELAINMYAGWCFKFWNSGWNVFDFVVVSIGLLTTFNVPLPGPLKMLRMMRAFRVFRLFKRIASLKKIMSSLAKAVPGVINAFVILILVMSIYAMLAVEFWSKHGSGGKITNEFGIELDYLTARGQEFGFEYFGNFPKALYTLFQVMTGESWSEAIARPCMHTTDPLINVASAFYFVSFQVLCATVLINVVVAVLLEKMVDDGAPAGEAESARASFIGEDLAGLEAAAAAAGAYQAAGADAGAGSMAGAREKDVADMPGMMDMECDGVNGGLPLVSKPLPPQGAAPLDICRMEADISGIKSDMEGLRAQIAAIAAALDKQSS